MDSDSSLNQRQVIQASEILDKIKRGEDVEYDDVIVKGDLDISGLELLTEHVDRTEAEKSLGLSDELKIINSPIAITNSEILGNIKFRNAFFKGAIDFYKAKFSGNADFVGAEFSRYVLFNWAEFRYAYFLGAKLGGNADFIGSKFGENANFTGAKFGKNADFSGAKFSRNAYFAGIKLGGNADFFSAEFGSANFRKAEFTMDANFVKAKFNGDADFFEAKFEKKFKLNEFEFKKLYLTWDSIRGKLACNGPVYLALIKNFKVIEQFSDADDCYYQYRKESQDQKPWYSKENWLIDNLVRFYSWISAKIKRISEYFSWVNNYLPFTWIHRFNWSKLLDWVGFVSCGYGVRLVPIFFWVLGSFLGFAFLYKLLPQSYGGIAESGPSTVTMEAVNNSTLLFTFSSGDGAVSPSWGECLYFSFTALTGGTPDELHPVGLCKYAVMIEGVLGYLFLALFVVVLARKIIR